MDHGNRVAIDLRIKLELLDLIALHSVQLLSLISIRFLTFRFGMSCYNTKFIHRERWVTQKNTQKSYHDFTSRLLGLFSELDILVKHRSLHNKYR